MVAADPSSSSIDPRYLQALGKRLSEPPPLGPPIHEDISVRWIDIGKEGLPEDERKDLLARFPIPENCPFLVPPKLNEELRASLTKDQLQRDDRISSKAAKLGTCLAITGKILSELSTIPDPNQKEESLFSDLGTQGRLLMDLFHDESNIRRSLVLSVVNPSMKDSLASTSIGDKLFGSDLEQTIKSAKALQATSKALQKTTKESSAKNSSGPSASAKKRPGGKSRNQSRSGQKRPSRSRKSSGRRDPPQKSGRRSHRLRAQSPKDSR